MTILELIVVFGIFSVLSGVTVFNYGSFQGKVDIKNLANDIALKIVEAQKGALFGKFPPPPQDSFVTSVWKPSYGVYFDLIGVGNRGFIYFTDINPVNNLYDGTSACTNECIEKTTITKGNTISELRVFYKSPVSNASFNDLTMSFTRPDSKAVMASTSAFTGGVSNIDYIQITIASPKTPPATATIKLYPSGRVQIN